MHTHTHTHMQVNTGQCSYYDIGDNNITMQLVFFLHVVGQDFEVEDNRATHELTFSPGGDTTECVDVTINDDSRTESLEETFPFSLVQRDSQATLGEPNSGTITIIDNDSK